MVVMSLMGIMILFGNQVFRSMNLFKINYQNNIEMAYNTSQLVDQIGKDLWETYTFDFDEGEKLLTLKGRFNNPFSSYHVFPAMWTRKKDDGRSELPVSMTLEVMKNSEGIIIQDSMQNAQYSFLLPPRSSVR